MKSDLDHALEILQLAAPALAAYGDAVVVVGGVVPYLYGRIYDAQDSQVPVMTREVDVMVPGRLPVIDTPLAERLEGSGLFPFEVPGMTPGSVGRQQFQRSRVSRPSPQYLEFLVHGDKAPVEPQKGVVAQQVRDLKLLYHEPLKFEFGGSPLNLPQPATFIVQKVTAWKYRTADRKDKNLAYIYNVAAATTRTWDETAASLTRLCAADPWSDKVVRKRLRELASLFRSVDSDGPLTIEDQFEGAISRRAAFVLVRAWLQTHLNALG